MATTRRRILQGTAALTGLALLNGILFFSGTGNTVEDLPPPVRDNLPGVIEERLPHEQQLVASEPTPPIERSRTDAFTETDVETMERFHHAEIDRLRGRYDAPPTVRVDAIDYVAAANSRNMVEGDFFAHTNPHTKDTHIELLRRYGVPVDPYLWAENISKVDPNGERDPEYLGRWTARRFMESRSHRRAQLKKENTLMGVGIVVDADATIYVTDLYADYIGGDEEAPPLEDDASEDLGVR